MQTHGEDKSITCLGTPNYSHRRQGCSRNPKWYLQKEQNKRAPRRVQHVFPSCNKDSGHCFLAMAPNTWGGTCAHREGAPGSHQT